MNVIKELVKNDLGITFMYKSAVQKEIKNGELCKIDISNFLVLREFNFVYLKDSIFENDLLQWFNIFNI